MPRLIKRSAKKIGLPPGTVMHVGEVKVEKTRIGVIEYDAEGVDETDLSATQAYDAFRKSAKNTWINFDGLHEVRLIEQLGKDYDLHPLILEDIVNTNQRPKAEEYDTCVFVVVKMLTYDDANHRVRSEHVSLVLGERYLLTFQEGAGDVFGPVRKRLRNPKGRLRQLGTDYLLYALLDCIVDHYFLVLEKLGEQIEEVQMQIVEGEDRDISQRINEIKREMLVFRKAVRPVREMVSTLVKDEAELVGETTHLYLNDLLDHAVQVTELSDHYREMIGGLIDVYQTGISNRMNNIMKVLTIIATIFIPLTFVAGIYGMNFEHMPELKWKWGYAAVWSVMLVLGAVMLIWFKKKRWL